jgi:hypothetical protein
MFCAAHFTFGNARLQDFLRSAVMEDMRLHLLVFLAAFACVIAFIIWAFRLLDKDDGK